MSYIIDMYDKLPDIIIFMHAHQFAWHNNELLDFDAAGSLRRLKLERVARLGYMNLRCVHDPGCPEWLHPYEAGEPLAKQEQGVLAQSWREIFPLATMPEVLAQPCCAQFAVSKTRVKDLLRSRYVYYRDWIMRTELTDYYSGRYVIVCSS